MEIGDFKHFARRLREHLKSHGRELSHGESLDVVAAISGLRNWPEVVAFPHRVAASAIDADSLARVANRIAEQYGICVALEPLKSALLTPLLKATAPAVKTEPIAAQDWRSVRLPTALQTRDLPGLYSAFAELIGERHWTKRAQSIRGEIRGAKHLTQILTEENAIAFALAHCADVLARYGTLVGEVNNASLYPTIRLAAQTLAILDQSKGNKREIVGRIQGALKNPADMRALEFELGIATHFARRATEMVFPELNGFATFDLLLPKLGARGLEVECKSISRNKGRRIDRRTAAEYFAALQRSLEPFANSLKSGLAVVITTPSKPPSGRVEREALCAEIVGAVLAGQSISLEHGGDVRITDFDIKAYPALGPDMTEQARVSVDEITRTQNREVMILGRKDRGAMVVVFQSAVEDTFLKSVFNVVDDAARRQLSGIRPGIVVVGLEGMSPNQLVATANQDQDLSQPATALRVAVSDFLRSESIPHLVAVAFASSDEMERTNAATMSSGGTAYYFPKRESSMWDEDFAGLFRSDRKPSPAL